MESKAVLANSPLIKYNPRISVVQHVTSFYPYGILVLNCVTMKEKKSEAKVPLCKKRFHSGACAQIYKKEAKFSSK